MNKFITALCLGAAFLLNPISSQAQTIGLKVNEIPKGLVIHSVSSNGEKLVATYLGQKGRTYDFSVQVSGRKSGNFTAREKYDAQGRMVRWIGNGSYNEKWIPHYCEFTLGSCVHKHRDQYSRGRTWVYQIERKGDMLTSLRRLKSESKWRAPKTVTLGPYNIRMKQEITRTDGTKWWRKVTKIVEP